MPPLQLHRKLLAEIASLEALLDLPQLLFDGRGQIPEQTSLAVPIKDGTLPSTGF